MTASVTFICFVPSSFAECGVGSSIAIYKKVGDHAAYMVKDSYSDRFRNSPVEELMRVVHPDNSEEFESEAIEAARAELDNRNVNETETDEIVEAINVEIATETARAELPLSNIAWFGFVVIGPLFLLSVGGAIALLSLGYRQRAKDAFGAILASFFFWAVIGLGLGLLLS